MAIINRGIFQLTDTVFERSVGNDWPTAQVLTTFEIAEGSNLYYTNARVLAYVNSLNLGSNLESKTTDDLREGTNLYYTNTRVLSHLAESDVDIYNLTVTGNLIVEGNTITLNTETVNVEDKNILLANGAVNAAAADGAGITIDGADATLAYVSASNKWQFNKSLLINSYDALTTGNTTTDLSEGNNLYYTNARVDTRISELSVNVLTDVDISGIQNNDIIKWNGSKFIASTLDESAASNVANTVLSISNFDTGDLTEGDNLYYTNSRARTAFTPGRGISISQSGLISSEDDSADFNLLLDTGEGKFLSNTLSNVLIFPTPAATSTRYILRTIQVTNIFDEEISVSGNLVMSGTPLQFANKVPIPEGGSVEFLKNSQAFNRHDSISMIGYTANGNPASNVATVSFGYETVPAAAGLFSTGSHISEGNTNITLYDFANTYGVIESIKIVNLSETETPKVKVAWTDANNLVLSYYSYNLPVPRNSTVEVITNTKRVNRGNKILVTTNSNAEISAIISGKLGEVTSLNSYPTEVNSGDSQNIYWETDLADGTTIYYTIE